MATDIEDRNVEALDSNPTYLIIGGIAGFIVLIIVITAASICFWYKRRRLMIEYQLYPTKVGGLID